MTDFDAPCKKCQHKTAIFPEVKEQVTLQRLEASEMMWQLLDILKVPKNDPQCYGKAAVKIRALMVDSAMLQHLVQKDKEAENKEPLK
jgi:hypothetical protein